MTSFLLTLPLTWASPQAFKNRRVSQSNDSYKDSCQNRVRDGAIQRTFQSNIHGDILPRNESDSGQSRGTDGETQRSYDELPHDVHGESLQSNDNDSGQSRGTDSEDEGQNEDDDPLVRLVTKNDEDKSVA